MLYIPERHPVAEQTPRGYMMTRPWLNLFNQFAEIIGLITAPGGIAPSNAQYIVASPNGILSAERVATDTPTAAWDFTNPSTAEVDVIVTAFILRGTRAAQPLATAVPEGTVYFVTDQKVTERSNGLVWQAWSTAQMVGAVTTIALQPGSIQILNDDSPAAAGSSTGHFLTRETAGDAGGTSVLADINLNLGVTGANSVSQGRAMGVDVNNDLSAGALGTHEGMLFTNRVRGAGSSGLVFAFRAILELSGTGNITNRYEAVRVNSPVVSSSGDITGFIRGVQISDVGRAAATTVDGVNIDALTKGSGDLHGLRSQSVAAAGKWNLYIDGTAQNYLRGNLGIGVGKSAPSVALDVAGDIVATGTISGAPSYASALMLMGG